MANAKKIMIGGFSGGGKSTLLRLFDGHPQLLSTQVHERFMRLFYDGRQEFLGMETRQNVRTATASQSFGLQYEGKNLNIRMMNFRAMLAKYTSYYQVEDDADRKTTYTGASSADQFLMSFDFDFPYFEATWKRELLSDPQPKTAEDLIDILYLSFFEAWKNYPTKYSEDKHLVFCASENPVELEFVFKNNFNAKIIYIDRDLRGVVATRVLRLKNSQSPIQKNFKNHNDFVLNGGVVDRLSKWKKKTRQLAEKYPNQMLFVNFEELILESQKAMKKISDFIGVTFDKNLLIPSHLGQQLDNGSGQYVGKINDSWERVLTPKDIFLSDYYENKAQGKRTPVFSLRLYSHLIRKHRNKLKQKLRRIKKAV